MGEKKGDYLKKVTSTDVLVWQLECGLLASLSSIPLDSGVGVA